MSRADLESCFADGWSVDAIQATTTCSTLHVDGLAAWLAACTRI
jgi:hypothetical protein